MTELWDVEASDGGAIAVWVDGNGPALVLVHGAISNHAWVRSPDLRAASGVDVR